MWGREEKLVRLNEELEILDIFDRVHDYDPDGPNRGENDAYVFRQKRRCEILAAIEMLGVRKPQFEVLRAGSVALVLCATLYATFHYLLK
jgi:hypothetical protein